MNHYATIIIGGGTMGTAAAWELGKRGERALVLEQFGHVHTNGSHSGQTRVIRHPYAEGADYIPLVLRADDLWVELEQITDQVLLHRVGGLELAAPGYHHAERARASAAEHSVPFEWIDADEVQSRWPTFRIPAGWQAGFGPRSGFLAVEPGLRAMAAEARKMNVEIREYEPVLGWGASAEGVWVDTHRGRSTADRLIITAGAWADKVLAELGLPFTVLRKVLWWLEVEEPERFAPERFPVFVTDSDFGEIYGFPIFGQPGFKIAVHSGGIPTTTESVNRTADDREKAEVVPAAQAFFPGVTGRVVNRAVCLYTNTPDGHFIIDRHPEWPNVVIGAGFSGHGFKFAPAIGEHLVNLAYDTAAQPYSILALDRFAALAR
ncbi:MAG TPA: N-methyl-L-tryptophan oxidase [Thermomicrobiales bacterium]|nr:N-methyl-L-tryptophan oxidase [Thermomicrobiales bacterium]